TLLAAWSEAKTGVARKVCIVGSAGIGKTRLITDTAARLRATRARVVWVRANPGEREIPYAFLSKLAGALATLPGAAAVSPASASALVALNPTLSSSFSAAADRATGPDALRNRTIAVHELLAAAADEAAVAVIVDDLHWSDRDSTRAFAGLSDLLEHERVLLVSAARPSNGGGQEIARDATVIRLVPLTVADTGALLASVAALPPSGIGQELPGLLRDASGGNPLLAIETLQFLLDQRSLKLERESWVVQDEPTVRQALNAGGALRRRIEALDAMERSVLIAVAMSGVPVPAGFAADVVRRPLADVAAVLHGLETRGMIGHVGEGWEPAHDQIGEMALATLPPERRAAIELEVGRAWMHGAPDDRALRRAGVHFLRADDRRAVANAFAAWVRLVRRSGDRRPAAALATEFLDREDATLVRALVQHLPIHHRYGGARWRAAATIAFVALASAAATWRWTRTPEPPPDEVLLAVAVDSAGDTTAYRVPIRRDRWTGGDVLVPSREGRRVHVALPATLGDYALTADGKAWISHAAMPDSGGDDLVMDRLSGGQRRLTWNPADDVNPDFSPDGRRLLFMTGRFDSLSHAHLAVMDIATGQVQQLTSGGPKDGSAKWSRNGLRIAFVRLSLTDAPDSVCTIAPNGEDPECRPTAYVTAVLGWIDDDRVLLTQQIGGGTALEVYDVADGSSRRIFHSAWGSFDLSPDGRWVACRCRETAASAMESVVFPLDHPELARTIAGSPLDTRLVWTLWDDR
ncbi:MAG: AAA family ATPase, partial [Gemmatimonadota bacterium]|nr:AAA family ATPase [Gemmatimonadota bacterium]